MCMWASQQVFHSFIHSPHMYCNRCSDSVMIPIINCCTSFYAGLAIFSVLGFMAELKDVPIADVAASGTYTMHHWYLHEAPVALYHVPRGVHMIYLYHVSRIGIFISRVTRVCHAPAVRFHTKISGTSGTHITQRQSIYQVYKKYTLYLVWYDFLNNISRLFCEFHITSHLLC